MIRVVVGLDLGRFWPRRRFAAGTIRRRNGLLWWEMAGWRRRYHLLQRKRQTLDSIASIQFSAFHLISISIFNPEVAVLSSCFSLLAGRCASILVAFQLPFGHHLFYQRNIREIDSI